MPTLPLVSIVKCVAFEAPRVNFVLPGAPTQVVYKYLYDRALLPKSLVFVTEGVIFPVPLILPLIFLLPSKLCPQRVLTVSNLVAVPALPEHDEAIVAVEALPSRFPLNIAAVIDFLE